MNYLGLICAVVIFLLTSLVFAHIRMSPFIILPGILIALLSVKVLVKKTSLSSFRKKDFLLVLPLLIPLVYQSLHVLYETNNDLFVLNPNNLGDMPYHLGLSTHLLHADFWPENFIFAGESLKYPFAVDFLHSLFQFFIRVEFVYPLLSLVFLGLSLLISLQQGGVLFSYLVFSNFNLWFFSQLDVDWKNIFLSVLIPQRGFLLALPIGLMLFQKTSSTSLGKEDLWRDAFIKGLLLGSLAWIHLHSFVFFVLFFILISIARKSFSLWKCLLVAFLISLPFVLHSTDMFSKVSTIHLSYFWNWQQNEALTWYILKNFGALILLPLVFYSTKRSEKLIFFVSLFLFGFFCFVIFSPWNWDNIKFLYWAYIGMVFALTKNALHKISKAFLVILIVLPSLAVIYDETFFHPNPQKIFDGEEIAKLQKWFADDKNKNATYLIYPVYNHPVFYYGAKVVMGYEGHLWSHGVNYGDKFEIVRTMQSEFETDILEKLDADYLIFSQIESAQWRKPESGFEIVYQYQDLVIYRSLK